MTNTWQRAFGQDAFGAKPNFWSKEAQEQRAVRQAEERELEAERAQLVAAMQAEEARQESLRFVGPALVNIVQRYADQGAPASTDQVEEDFKAAFPGMTSADFQAALTELIRDGVLYQAAHGSPGFMGLSRATNLYVL